MARQAKAVLLLILAVVSAAYTDVEKPLTENYFDQLVREALNRNEKVTCPGCCALGWVKYNGRCHIYHGFRMDWASAEAHCLSLGANLMSVHSENDYQLAKSLVRSSDPQERPTWLGLSNCQKRGSWFWSDGIKLDYTRWNPNEPDFQNGQCCVSMNQEYGTWRDWNDISCDQTFAFLCAKPV